MEIFTILKYLSIIGAIVYLLRKYFNGPKTPLRKDMTGKTIIVTGSNAGIGKTTALDLLENGARVIFACRDQAKTNLVINKIKDQKMRENASFMKLDLGSFNSIITFAEEFKKKFNSLDILINNAGATFDNFNTKENIEATIMTNLIGPICLTALLINSINPQGKIINVSSRSHIRVTQSVLDYLYAKEDFSNIRDKYMHMGLYGLSKIGNIYHSQYLAKYFERNHLPLKTASLHPGLVNTEIFSTSRFTRTYLKIIMTVFAPLLWLVSKDVKMGAQTTLHLAYMDFSELNSGAYFNNCKEHKLGVIPASKEKREEFIKFTHNLILKHFKNPPKEILEYLKN